MNKQQMVEWLAENVLGCTYCKDCDVWVSDTVKDDIVEFIYSPDGFFAVWDAVIKNKFMYFGWRNEGPPHDSSNRCTISKLVPSPESTAYGDRYEAFYNAVYEAMSNVQ